MSYNYDYDPWADTNPSQGSQQQQPTQDYGSSDPYNQQNNQYSSQSYDQQYSQQDYNAYGNQSQQQQQEYNEVDQQQQQQQQQQQEPQPQPASSYCNNIPFVGPLLATLSIAFSKSSNLLFKYVNRDLLVSKVFYFFFYSAFGSLFPLMGVYFKQLGMNPAQVGILTGIRPFIEIFSAPFWNSLAERFRQAKSLLLFSLIAWIVFTYSLAHIRPPASACIAFNDTDYILYTPYSGNDLANYDVGSLEDLVASPEDSKTVQANMSGSSDQQANARQNNEKKDKILTNEETQNARRRRRRVRRATSKLEFIEMSKAMKKLEATANNGKYISEDLPKIELVNDFTDDFVKGNWRLKRSLDEEELESTDEKENKSTENSNNNEDETKGDNEKSSEDEDDEGGKGGEKKQEETEQTETENNDDIDTNRQEGKESNKKIGSTSTNWLNSPSMINGGINNKNATKRVYRQRHKTPPTHIVGMSPITVEYAANYVKEKHSQFVAPMFSTIVYKLDDIKEVFFLLLLLIALGEFFSAPALTLADSATLSYLGERTDSYGRQRMFGSLSWAITLLFVGMALDNSKAFADHPCGPHIRERSYTVCFVIFALLMFGAFLTATQFRFHYSSSNSANGNSVEGQKSTVLVGEDGSATIMDSQQNGNTQNIDNLYSNAQPRSIFNTAPPINAPAPGKQSTGAANKFEYLEKWKSAMFAQRTRELPQWLAVLRQFNSSLHLLYLFITWFLGCGVGLVFTFLFWHLQDVGGTPTLFGICSIINHISEILAYFFSINFIKTFGHTKVLAVGLGCNVVRFLYVAFLTNPYYALPFELVQGITHSACFAACCSYVNRVAKPELRSSTQGVMQGLHHGVGRACGTLIGGYMINAIGSRASFCIYGLMSGAVLAGLLYVRKLTSESDIDEAKVDVDSGEALGGGFNAPQGVPSAGVMVGQTGVGGDRNMFGD